MKTMRCPFLSRVPMASIKQKASAVWSMAQYCPIMSKTSYYASIQSQLSSNTRSVHTEAPACPFHKNSLPTVSTANVSKALPGTMDKKAQDKDEKEELIKGISTINFDYEGFYDRMIEKKKMDNSYRVFKKVQRRGAEFPYADVISDDSSKKPVQVWCSNDYLGMSWHKQVMEAVHNSVDKFGVGAGGTRNISGNSPAHVQLEKELAKFHQKEAALLFTSCYVANDTTLCTLAKMLPGCHIFSDSGNHASMIQGIRNSGVPKHVFRHNDAAHLRQLLSQIPKATPKVVAFETVYSMSGDICPLDELLTVSEEFGAVTFIDEVHAVGLYGYHGAGVGEREGLLHRMDIITGTLGKAFGNIGGYVATSASLADMLRSYGSGFIFTTSLPPTSIAGSLQALEIIQGPEGRKLRQTQQDNVKLVRRKLVAAGVPVASCPSHIIPIQVNEAKLCTEISNSLISNYGIYVHPINYPTVPRGQEMLRVAPTPHHNGEMIEYFVESVVSVFEQYGLLKDQPIQAAPVPCQYSPCVQALLKDYICNRWVQNAGVMPTCCMAMA